MRLSERAQQMQVSPIRNLVRPQNPHTHVYALNIGQPDLPSPPEFLTALKSFDSTTVAYDGAQGNTELITHWTHTLNRAYNINCTHEHMVITQGSSEALAFALNICCDAGDEVLVFTPTYANYTGFATMAGVTLRAVECEFESNFHLPESFQVTDKTRAILLCSPNNPTGTVYSDSELQAILAVCEQHDLFLIVDEVYREFVYDGKQPRTIFQIAPQNQRIIVVDSLSKRYSLCGARIGCLLSWNSDVIAAATNFASTRVSAPTVEQVAAASMLKTLSTDYLTHAVETYRQRRDVLIAELSKIDGVEVQPPEGGFYVFAKLPVDDSRAFAQFMLQNFELNGATVFVSPANGFRIQSTDTPTSFVRIAFVLNTHDLVAAAHIVKCALTAYTLQSTN